jgi:hypothetical protein
LLNLFLIFIDHLLNCRCQFFFVLQQFGY